jgi:hypothetical protein
MSLSFKLILIRYAHLLNNPGRIHVPNESGSKGCGKIARGASARAARHVHPILEHADRGSVLKGRTRERMSYAEAARGKLPFQLP